MTSHLESCKGHAQERMKQLHTVMQRMKDAPDDVGVLFGGDTNLRDTEVSVSSQHWVDFCFNARYKFLFVLGLSGSQSGPAVWRLWRVGATGQAGALPLHMGHQGQQQQDRSLRQPLPLRSHLPPASLQGRSSTSGPGSHGPNRTGEAGLWPLHKRSLGPLLQLHRRVETLETAGSILANICCSVFFIENRPELTFVAC